MGLSEQQALYIQELYDAREDALAQLRNVIASPQPSYSKDGESISFQQFYDFLKGMISAYTDEIRKNQGPKMVKTIGRG